MVASASTAFIFPGQGAQVVGMGKDIFDSYAVAREIFQEADDLLNFSLSDLMFEGDEATLGKTVNTQPALFVYGIAMLKAFQAEYPHIQPSFVAGHSFGEFTALVAAEALSFEEGLRLVRERGRVMDAADQLSPGGMAAILGLDVEKLRQVCQKAVDQVGGVLVVANDNCPGQTVISGNHETLDAGIVLAKEAGARRAIKLAVSIGSHSPLMQPAATEFNIALERAHFSEPKVPVYGNVKTLPLTTIVEIRDELEKQLTHPVRWTESIQRMSADGAERFIEFSPKDVLIGLLKRIDSTKQGYSLNNAEVLKQFG